MLFWITASHNLNDDWDNLEDDSSIFEHVAEEGKPTKDEQIKWLNEHFKSILEFLDTRKISDQEENKKIVSYIRKMLYNVQHHMSHVLLSQSHIIEQWDSMKSKHELDLKKLDEYISDSIL